MNNLPEHLTCKRDAASLIMSSLVVASLFIPNPGYSQSGGETELKEAVEFAIQTLPANQLGLYNGRDYTPSTITAGGHPYFATDQVSLEKIVYDGITYKDVYLIFDASRQLVVIEDHAGNKICPVQEKIESFTLDVHTFKWISSITGLTPGFYDVLIDGKLFAKRSKSAGGMQWKSSSRYFFLNDNKVFQLTDKKSVVEGMADRENDIRRYIRTHTLSFRKKKDTSFAEVVRYYSSLKIH